MCQINTNPDQPHSRHAGHTLISLHFQILESRAVAGRDSIAVFGAKGAFGPRLVLSEIPDMEGILAQAGVEVPDWARDADRKIAINQDVEVSELKGSREDQFLEELEDAVSRLGGKQQSSRVS